MNLAHDAETTTAKKIGRLHVITDTVIQSRFTHAVLAEMAVEGGADTIQFRQKTGTTRQLIESARALQAICAHAGVPLIVNDRADVALAVGAAGVHLGQDDLPIAIGRRILPAEMIIGATAKTELSIQQAITEGADYIGFGPIYQTTSKSDAQTPKGLEGLRHICSIATCPVIAIGGITIETASAVMEAGAYGIAVISAVCAAVDPVSATRRLLAEIC